MADQNVGAAASAVDPASQAIMTQLTNLQAQPQQLQQDNVTLSTKLMALCQANQGGGAGGGQAAQQGVQAALSFTLTPATTNLTGLLDYKSKLGQSIYKQGCDKLTPDGEEFTMTPATTVAFVKAFKNRCNIMGWNSGTQHVTKFFNQDNVMINTVKNYGQIAEQDLKVGCCETFCGVGGARHQAQATQNNHKMAQCLTKSLASAAKTRLEVFQSQYTLNGVDYGLLIYKKIMQLATINSVATTETLRANLTNLPIYAASVNSDINLINSYFNVNYSQILARGATIDNPVSKLFDTYLSVSDYAFKEYMKKKLDAYHDGNLETSFSHEKLMAQATAKFTYLTTRGLWGS